jgi:hypothetical protein
VLSAIALSLYEATASGRDENGESSRMGARGAGVGGVGVGGSGGGNRGDQQEEEGDLELWVDGAFNQFTR